MANYLNRDNDNANSWRPMYGILQAQGIQPADVLPVLEDTLIRARANGATITHWKQSPIPEDPKLAAEAFADIGFDAMVEVLYHLSGDTDQFETQMQSLIEETIGDDYSP